MANQFLSKIRVAPDDFVRAADAPVLERHADLQALLSERAGPEVAALFAEPLISRGNDEAAPTVAWYADAAGEAQPLSRLSPAEQDRISAYLSDHLRPLRTLAEDPAQSDLAWGALTTYGADDVMVADGRPFIVNWGLMPDGRGASAAARPAHFEATLGRFMRQPTAAAKPSVAPAVAAAPVPAPPPIDEPEPRARLSLLAWVPLLVLLLIAAAVLFWLLQPGTRLLPEEPPRITEAGTLDAQNALNASLRERIASLETALDGAVCRADGVLILPGGLTPEGLLPPAEGTAFPEQAAAAPDALLPNKADRVLVPNPEAPDQPDDLVTHLDNRTVLVLAEGPSGVAAGSGFSIGNGHILTNQHVIDLGPETRVVVIGKALPEPLAADVLKASGPLAETGDDFALLQVEANDLPGFTLHQPPGSLRLSNVIAAGFPGDVLELDLDFAGLMRGDAGAVPALTVTDGIVNTEQQLAPDTNVLMHSAPLSTGNSGGPLVDMCGRVVGINSFVRKGPLQNRSYALAMSDVLEFLQGTPAQPVLTEEACAPQVRPQVAQSVPAEE
ncbi:S1 family peptidase [Ruegeria jejuensis]|uniref:S1 family peptidase n=1 Tax=Ruegeria jejuensis TaxID=3233338 RepID=UPI00355C6CDC